MDPWHPWWNYGKWKHGIQWCIVFLSTTSDIILVKRDQERFKVIKEKIDKFWNEVLKFREIGHDSLLLKKGIQETTNAVKHSFIDRIKCGVKQFVDIHRVAKFTAKVNKMAVDIFKTNGVPCSNGCRYLGIETLRQVFWLWDRIFGMANLTMEWINKIGTVENIA